MPSNHLACVDSTPTSEPPEFLFTELGSSFIFPFFVGTGASKPSVGTDAASISSGSASTCDPPLLRVTGARVGQRSPGTQHKRPYYRQQNY
ncbi:MAG: hypothetical protein M3334_14480 [Actinomycetota bacterium]|nr:hypothetical protein [Actinomycetota bacterium]